MFTHQSLGVFGPLLSCHRDVAARAVFAQSLVQWPESGTVKHKQETGKLLLPWLSPSPSHHHHSHITAESAQPWP